MDRMKGFSPNRSDFRARALVSKRSANMKEMLFFVLFYEILCTFMAKFFEQGYEVSSSFNSCVEQ